MRRLMLTLAILAAACSPKSEDTHASDDPTQVLQGSAPSVSLTGAGIDVHAIIGTWSFDKSCASGDGMTIAADGVASYDEWGLGTWRIEEGRLVLDLATQEPGLILTPTRRTRSKL